MDLKALLPKEAMKRTIQDTHFHEEGSVWDHTLMTEEALKGMPEFLILESRMRETVMAAALFHDCGKAFVTRVVGGRVGSPGHALRGAVFASSALYRASIFPPMVRERVVALVLHHGVPLSIFIKDSDRKIIRASLSTDSETLSILAEADVLGRKCESRSFLMSTIGLYKEEACRLGCSGVPTRFHSSHSRFVYFNEGKDLYDAYDDTKFEVTVMSGLPGSGKDTWIRDHYNGPVISLDEFREKLGIGPSGPQGRVVAAAQEAARVCMRKRASFAWNATNTTSMMRSKVVRFLRQYGARIRIVYVESPYDTVVARNASRKNPVPSKVMEKMVDSMEVPRPEEAHEISWIW